MNFENILDIIENSTGVSIDTRTISKGNVFFAIKGENFDGNKFIEKALEDGAVLAISSDKKYTELKNVIVVDNVLKTMQYLAKQYRRRFEIPVIAVTGTNGKTTTKELLCSILSGKYDVLCTKGNFNNHIGVPLTLFGLNSKHNVAVVEMGASSMGEIKFLCNIAEPDLGLITSIGKAHIEGFGSFANIIKTKLELKDYLCENNGKFFFNKAVSDIKSHLTDPYCIEEFSSNEINGKTISSIQLLNVFPFLSIEFLLKNGKTIKVDTKLYGTYNFDNIVNAVKISDYFGLDVETIINKLSEYLPKNNRSQIIEWNTNTIILDAYNANPSSMTEALKSFIEIDTDKNKYLILGDMLELGNISLVEHKKIIDFIAIHNEIKGAILVGKEFSMAKKDMDVHNNRIEYVNNSEEAKKKLDSLNLGNSLILAKGSRGIKIESVFLQT